MPSNDEARLGPDLDERKPGLAIELTLQVTRRLSEYDLERRSYSRFEQVTAASTAVAEAKHSMGMNFRMRVFERDISDER